MKRLPATASWQIACRLCFTWGRNICSLNYSVSALFGVKTDIYYDCCSWNMFCYVERLLAEHITLSGNRKAGSSNRIFQSWPHANALYYIIIYLKKSTKLYMLTKSSIASVIWSLEHKIGVYYTDFVFQKLAVLFSFRSLMPSPLVILSSL